MPRGPRGRLRYYLVFLNVSPRRTEINSQPITFSFVRSANEPLSYATCCADAASDLEYSESQTHASFANHSCIAWQSGQ